MTTTVDTGARTLVRRWKLDRNRSRVEFRIGHFWGLVRVRGRFHDVAGTRGVADDGSRRIELEVEAASLDTGNTQRDRHLRSDDFFDAADHPLVRFESTEIADDGQGGLRVTGTLEAAGRSVAVAFSADVEETDDEIDVYAAVDVDQRELGMTWSPLGMVRGPARVTVRARLRAV